MLAPVVEFQVDDLRPYERNARKHSKRQLETLKAAIKRFGFNVPIGVWQDGMILAGHGRWEAAKSLGMETVSGVDLSDMTLDEARAYCLADNRIADMARWDDDLLKAELADLHGDEVRLDEIGFTENELAKLVDDFDLTPAKRAAKTARTQAAEAADSDEADEQGTVGPDPLIGPDVVERGEVWQIGEHRLVCGDSTDPDVVAQVAGEGEVALLLTDPPYGVDYAGKQAGMNKALGNKGNDAVIANDDRVGDELRAFISAAFKASYPALAKGAAFYAFSAPGADGQLGIMLGLDDAGLAPRHGLVWVKNRIVLSRADVNYQHEAIHYGWKPGAAHKWYGPTNETSVWECNNPRSSKAHPTMKPVELLERAIRNSSQAGDLVLDIFGGSGSTLVAAHNRGRRAALVELNVQFASVICRRARHELGIEPVRASDGLTFTEKEAALAKAGGGAVTDEQDTAA